VVLRASDACKELQSLLGLSYPISFTPSRVAARV
jgi:hypothetical protein